MKDLSKLLGYESRFYRGHAKRQLQREIGVKRGLITCKWRLDFFHGTATNSYVEPCRNNKGPGTYRSGAKLLRRVLDNLPGTKNDRIFNLNEQGKYGRPDVYSETDHITVNIAGFVACINLAEVFSEM